MPSTSSPPISERPQWERQGAPPLYATPRNPDRYSEGGQVGIIANILGTPLIPWQQYVADVATERRDDGSYEYELVVVSVPRQCGKTSLMRAMGVQRALAGRDVFYTAQSLQAARARWNDLVEVIDHTPAFAGQYKKSLRGGSEHLKFLSSRAVFQIFTPEPAALHGYTPPTVMIDEAWEIPALKGDLLMGGIDPAQFTIVDKQIWIVSTMGTAESTFLHDWIDKGMEGADRVACFVWGANDDQSPYELEDIAAYHPGVGYVLNGKLIGPDDVLKAVEKNGRAEYERAYGNRRTATTSHLIPAAAWGALKPERLTDFTAPASTSDVVLTFDVDNTRDQSAILSTWLEGDLPRVKVVQAGPGVAWLAPAVDKLRRSWKPKAVGAVGSGPVLDVINTVNRLAGYDVVTVLNERDYATATSALLNRIDEHSLEHDGDEVLATSVVGLVTRAAGSDGVAFSRIKSVGNSAPAIAATAGVWIASNRPRSIGKPVLYFGKESA